MIDWQPALEQLAGGIVASNFPLLEAAFQLSPETAKQDWGDKNHMRISVSHMSSWFCSHPAGS